MSRISWLLCSLTLLSGLWYLQRLPAQESPTPTETGSELPAAISAEIAPAPTLKHVQQEDQIPDKETVETTQDAFAQQTDKREVQLATLRQKLGDNHPKVQALQDQLNAQVAQQRASEAVKSLDRLTVFRLKLANAVDFGAVIQTLHPDIEQIVVDARTNSLLVRGDEAMMTEIEQLIQVLDVDAAPAPSRPKMQSSFGSGRRKSVGTQPKEKASSANVSPRPSLEQLMASFSELESRYENFEITELLTFEFDSVETQSSLGIKLTGRSHKLELFNGRTGGKKSQGVLEYNIDGKPQPLDSPDVLHQIDECFKVTIPVSLMGVFPFQSIDREDPRLLSAFVRDNADKVRLEWDGLDAKLSFTERNRRDVQFHCQLWLLLDAGGNWVPRRMWIDVGLEDHKVISKWELPRLLGEYRFSSEFKRSGAFESQWTSSTGTRILEMSTGFVVTHEESGGSVEKSEANASLTDAHLLQIFSLKNAAASDTGRVIEQLFEGGSIPITLAVDERTNAIIMRGSAAQLEVAEAVMLRLDSTLDQDPPNKGASDSTGASSLDPIDPASPFQETLQSACVRLDQQAQEVASRVREAESKQGSEHPDVIRLRSELRESVSQALQARHRMQRAELAQFQERMRRLQRSLENRDRIADKIIERRVEELLDPSLKWQQKAVPEAASDQNGTRSTK